MLRNCRKKGELRKDDVVKLASGDGPAQIERVFCKGNVVKKAARLFFWPENHRQVEVKGSRINAEEVQELLMCAGFVAGLEVLGSG